MGTYNPQAAFPKLNGMQIGGIDKLKIIWHYELAADSFCQLENLKVKNCKNLMKIIQSHMYHRLCNLKSKLVISNCEMLEEVFDLEIPNDHQETSKITHIQLKDLRLEILPKLKHVWSKDPRGTFKFQDLQSFIVSQCQSLKNLFPTSVAKSLLKLQKLHITICAIEEIVAKDEGTEIEPQKFVFPRLEEMVLVNLPNLVSFYPGLHTSSWPSLSKIDVVECMKVKVLMSEVFSFQEMHGLTHHDIPFQQPLFLVEKENFLFASNIWQRGRHNPRKLFIYNCDMMEEVFEIQISNDHHPETSETTFIQLRNLTLAYLPKLKHVWTEDPQGTLTFQNLQAVEAYECHSLKNLFPPSVARSLVQLQKLHINNCGIEEIVAKEEGLEAESRKFVLPQLEVMELMNLPNLVSFYPGPHTSSWPSLRKLDMVGCMKVKVFASELCFSFHEEHELAHHDIPNQLQPLFSVEKVGQGTPRMTMISQDQLTAGIFGELDEINVYGCKSLTKMFSSNILRRLHNLSKLVISNCDMMEEVFEIQISNDHHPETSETTFIQLRNLTLAYLPKLKHVWTDDPRGTLTFQNLQVVEAYECHSLKNLFPPSVARSLVQLQKLYINNCGIEEIVAKEEGLKAEPRKFVLPQLEVMWLINLPNLVSFYPGPHTSSWPSWRKLDMVGCMKVKVFASELCFSFHEEHELAHHDIPNQLQPLFSVDKVGQGKPRMTMISQDQLTAGIFGELEEINVYDCKSLTKMFSSNILRRLHNLSKLVMSNCEMMEEVFEIQTSNDHHHDTQEAIVPIHLTMFKLSL
nr:uncharacterized protein LOC125421414 [Ziziphus jujuba var. spinosa]XP_048326371.1 uncharacterized protein LOC125421414 [Ziziphus jujuba var. spinosa]